jgi:hypothetical protein
LGVGTTAPNEKITIQSTSGQGAAITLRGNNNTSTTEFYVGQGADNQAYVWQRGNSNLQFGTNNITRLTISNSGQAAFTGDVNTTGNLYINNAAPTIYFQDTDNRSAMIACNSSTLYILRGTGTNSLGWQGSPYPLQINLENNDATFGGNISAGNISAGTISCAAINTNNNVVRCSRIFAGSYDNTLWEGQGAYMSWNNDGGSGRTWFTCQRGGGAGGWVFALNNGNVVGGASAIIGPTGSYWASSDHRLKSNVVILENCLQKTLGLKPVSYTYTSTQTTEIGFIAHEVQEVVPEAVEGEKDAEYENGSPNYQALNYSALLPILTGAIQQLSQKLDKLEAELNELKKSRV